MSLSIYMKGYYEEFHALGRRKNKANSKPNKLVLSVVEWTQSISYCVLRDAYCGKEKGKNAHKFGVYSC